jgi:hypothetical protein
MSGPGLVHDDQSFFECPTGLEDLSLDLFDYED